MKRTALHDDSSAQPSSKRRRIEPSTKAPRATWRHLPTEIQQDILGRVLHDSLVDAATTNEKGMVEVRKYGLTSTPSFKMTVQNLERLAVGAEKPGLLVWPLQSLRPKAMAARDYLENRMAPTVHTGRRLADMQAMPWYREFSMAFAMERRHFEFRYANVERIIDFLDDPTAAEPECYGNGLECGGEYFGTESYVWTPRGCWSFCTPKSIARITQAVADRMFDRDMSELFEEEPVQEERSELWMSSVPVNFAVYTVTRMLVENNQIGYRERHAPPP